MSKYQQYRFVDESGCCLTNFVDKAAEDDIAYNKRVASLLRRRTVEVSDMCCFRDDLQNAGFVWGMDFYFKKEGKGE